MISYLRGVCLFMSKYNLNKKTDTNSILLRKLRGRTIIINFLQIKRGV